MVLFFKKREKKTCQKGFSLVEVLCAVVLLAIIATPILQVISTSLMTNIKSRRLLAASDLASDTMEFVSSLNFNDLTYTDPDDSKEYRVTGLKRYYWGGNTPDESSLILYNDGILYPDGPSCTYDDLTGDANSRELTVKNIDVDGFKYDMIINMKKQGADDDQYYWYDVSVKVYDNKSGKFYTKAATSIANQY